MQDEEHYCKDTKGVQKPKIFQALQTKETRIWGGRIIHTVGSS